MTQEKRKEILEACHYGFAYSEIVILCGISEGVTREITENGLDRIEDLEVRKYD